MSLSPDRDDAPPVAIPPAARAFLAWQLASHWGNRHFVRPRPRAEVVSAALLAGAGWLDAGGGVASEVARPVTPHLDLVRWRSSVDRAAQVSRYAALLLAARHADRVDLARSAALWREALLVDARYRPVLDGAALAANLALLAAWERLVDGVCGQGSSPFSLPAPARTGPAVEVTLQPLGDRCWRVRPWPLEGGRLQLHCEVRCGGVGDGGAEGIVERVTFTLQRPAARTGRS